MDALISALFAITLLFLFAILLIMIGVISLELRWILRVWTKDLNDPWLQSTEHHDRPDPQRPHIAGCIPVCPRPPKAERVAPLLQRRRALRW
jgi:hypothetical protein